MWLRRRSDHGRLGLWSLPRLRPPPCAGGGRGGRVRVRGGPALPPFTCITRHSPLDGCVGRRRMLGWPAPPWLVVWRAGNALAAPEARTWARGARRNHDFEQVWTVGNARGFAWGGMVRVGLGYSKPPAEVGQIIALQDCRAMDSGEWREWEHRGWVGRGGGLNRFRWLHHGRGGGGRSGQKARPRFTGPQGGCSPRSAPSLHGG